MNETLTYEPIDLIALQQKDRNTFALLVDQYPDHIYRVGLKMLGNEQDAEDVLQETFIKALHHIDRFEGRSKISTWLYRIAVHESLILIRKRKDNLAPIDAGSDAIARGSNRIFRPKNPKRAAMTHTPHLNCNDILGNLNDYLGGELDQALCKEIEAHIENCPNCKIVLNTLRKTIHIDQVDGQDTHIPDDVRRHLLEHLNLDQSVNQS